MIIKSNELFDCYYQWRRWGKMAGEAPEARQIVVAETILVPFNVTGVAIG